MKWMLGYSRMWEEPAERGGAAPWEQRGFQHRPWALGLHEEPLGVRKALR